jgi:hypothetical protein
MKTKIILLLLAVTSSLFSQWQPDVRLTNAANSSYLALNGRPTATNATNIHVVWYDYRDAQLIGGEGVNIYYKRSTNNGVSWSSDIKIVNDLRSSFEPSIDVYQNNIHVVWYDDRHGRLEIYYKRSTDDGITWGSDVRLTNAAEDSEDPLLYVIGTSVHVVWSDWRDGNWEIYYKRSTNNGVNWSSDVRLTNSTGFSEHPHVATTPDGQTIHVVWQDYRDGNYEIYYKRSTNGGVNWGSDTRLTNATGNSRWPSLAISGTTIHLTWTDDRTGTEQIYYKKSTNNGISWTSDVRVVDQRSVVSSVVLSHNGQLVHLVWMDYRHGTNNREIYYKRSVDAGASWESDVRLTSNSADQACPGVAIGVQTVHVFWHDYRDGNWEIYSKRNPTGNTTWVQNISSEIPAEFKLEQNYPNPFNPVTTLKFDIPKLSYVKITVYDILGREVSKPVEQLLEAGRYMLNFDASGLSSGTYLYRINAGEFTDVRKMVVVR